MGRNTNQQNVVRKQLGQLRPGVTTPVSIYSPPPGVEAIIHNVIVCNTSNNPRTYRIFLDDDGTTYDETTALIFDVSVPGGTSELLEANLMMNNSNGNLAVRSDTNDAFTFTVNGEEFS